MTTVQRIPWWRIDFKGGEAEKVSESIANEKMSMGSVTSDFEANLAEALNVPYALTTTSGSVAILLALMTLGIGRDDEIIIPDRTWIATAHAAVMVGAKVVLVDVRSDQPTIDVSKIEEKITPKTKAIMPVHLNGRDSGMDEINAMAQKHGLLVVEDAAQAIFSHTPYGYLGTQSAIGCFSLAVTKIISTSQGGFVVTKDEETYEQLKLVRNHGVVDNFTDTWAQMGFNFKFNDILSSIGMVQLEQGPERVKHVTKIYERYSSAINEMESPYIKTIPVDVASGEVPVWFEIVSSKRDELIEYMAGENIQTRPVAPSLHTSDYLGNPGEFPNSDAFSEQGMFLPCGPGQPLENVDRVIEVLNGFARSH